MTQDRLPSRLAAGDKTGHQNDTRCWCMGTGSGPYSVSSNPSLFLVEWWIWHGRSPFFRFILQVLQRTLQFYLQRHTITDLFWIKGMGKMISQGPFLSLDWASGEWTQTLFCMTVFLTLVQLSPAHMSSLHWKLEVRKPLSFILHFNDGSTALPILSTDIPCTALRQK